MAKLRVREVAESKGIRNAQELADATGLNYATAWRLWNNPQYNVKVQLLGKVSDALGCSIRDLLENGPKVEALGFVA
jgi:DNA-binding Xre family transcriptional regulator